MSDSTLRTLRTILAGLHGVLAIKNKALAYEVVNPAFAQFLGKAPEEIVGKADADLFPAAEATSAAKEQKSVLSSGIPRRVELQLTGKDGIRWFDLSLSPVLDDNGDPDGVMISGHEVTAIKQREASIAQAESRVAEATQQAAVAEEKLKTLHAEAKELENAAQQVQEHLRQREKQLAQALKQTAALEAQLQEQQGAAQAQLADAENRAQTATAALAEAEQRAQTASAAQADAERRAQESEAALHSAQEAASRAAAEHVELRTQMATLQAASEALETVRAEAALLAQQLVAKLS